MIRGLSAIVFAFVMCTAIPTSATRAQAPVEPEPTEHPDCIFLRGLSMLAATAAAADPTNPRVTGPAFAATAAARCVPASAPSDAAESSVSISMNFDKIARVADGTGAAVEALWASQSRSSRAESMSNTVFALKSLANAYTGTTTVNAGVLGVLGNQLGTDEAGARTALADLAAQSAQLAPVLTAEDARGMAMAAGLHLSDRQGLFTYGWGLLDASNQAASSAEEVTRAANAAARSVPQTSGQLPSGLAGDQLVTGASRSALQRYLEQEPLGVDETIDMNGPGFRFAALAAAEAGTRAAVWNGIPAGPAAKVRQTESSLCW